MQKRFYYFLALSFLCLFAQQALFAQMQISGMIKDAKSGETLIGATIMAIGTNSGTAADLDGKYALTMPAGASSIRVSYAGYQEQVISITKAGIYDIALLAISKELDAVVVSDSRRQERVLYSPSSISTIQAKEIKNIVATTPSDYVANASGVDLLKTGLVGTNIVVRGFNNIFGGSLLSLVDGRITALPSLRANTQYMISTHQADIERIEVLKGPASAMYGPNSSNGVMQIITNSPIDMKEKFSATISLGAGMRSSLEPVTIVDEVNPANNISEDGNRLATMFSGRIASKLLDKEDGLKIGLKVSGKYFLGDEWRYRDPFEPQKIAKGKNTADGPMVFLTDGTERLKEEVLADSLLSAMVDSVDNSRNFDSKIWNVDSRLDFRFSKRTQLIFAGGLNNSAGIEMTGLGAAQSVNWQYYYGQIRFIHKKLFAQVYLNGSNSGEKTYLMRDGNLVTDRSKFISAQIQHSSDLLKEKLNLIYGIDALLTRPDTKYTINGRNEDSDNIDEYGAYLQAKYAVIPKIDLLAALRVDKHTFVEDVFLSPRAAIVYKASPTQSVRLTYNRAFSSPSALNTSLDILSGTLPTGINVRGVGNRGGFQFSYDDAGLPQYRTPFSADPNQYYSLGNASVNNTTYGIAVNLLSNGLKQISANFGIPASLVDQIVAAIIPSSIANDQVGNVLRTFTTNPASPFGDIEDPSTVKDFGGVKNSVTQTIELGYKGIIKDKLALTVDVYKTDISDFVTPLVVRTPNVFLNPTDVQNAIAGEIAAAMADPVNGVYTTIVTAVLDTAETIQGIYVGGNQDGSSVEELVRLITSAAAQIPFGTVNPVEQGDPSMLLTYSNFGDVSLYGAEVGVNYYATDDLKIGANFGWVSDDEFETEGKVIALNAPAFKVGANISYTYPKWGLDVGLRYRWQDAFPVNSGVYAGNVSAMSLVDLNLGYALPFSKKTQVSLSIQNLLNSGIPMVVGAPRMGRMSMLQITHTFSK